MSRKTQNTGLQKDIFLFITTEVTKYFFFCFQDKNLQKTQKTS